jgi:membrane dipeptidase
MLICDAHLDLAMNALFWNRDLTLDVEQIRQMEKGLDGPSRGNNTVSIPEMKKGKIALCVGTIIARTSAVLTSSPYVYTNPQITYASAMGQLVYYRTLSDAGLVNIIKTKRALTTHMSKWRQWERQNETPASSSEIPPVGVILGMEGADPIVWPHQVRNWYDKGLRIVGLSHYGEGRYAYGTDTTGGLKPPAFELLKYMFELGMCLDLSHLADEAFWEVMDRWPGLVMASHTNCRTLVPGQRQFSDEQIKAIIAKGGIIGVVFDAWMLQKGWTPQTGTSDNVSLESVADHIDHIVQLADDTKHVAIGSDLDGGFGRERTPKDVQTISDLGKLIEVLNRRGYTPEDISKIMYSNWENLFLKVLK